MLETYRIAKVEIDTGRFYIYIQIVVLNRCRVIISNELS